jgi:hypothetical protein
LLEQGFLKVRLSGQDSLPWKDGISCFKDGCAINIFFERLVVDLLPAMRYGGIDRALREPLARVVSDDFAEGQ